MRRLVTAGILAAIGWQGYNAYNRTVLEAQEPGIQRFTEAPESEQEGESEPEPEPSQDASTDSDSRYSCDGRTRCTQMTSCDEATWFINHCPGMKMDGDGDGIPCETQWCEN